MKTNILNTNLCTLMISNNQKVGLYLDTSK